MKVSISVHNCKIVWPRLLRVIKFEWTSDRPSREQEFNCLRLRRVSKCPTDQFLCFQKLLKLTSPQIVSIELFLWLVEQNVSTSKYKFPQDMTSFSIGSPLSTLSVSACVHAAVFYHTTLLIDTNRTKFYPLHCTLMYLISQLRISMLMELNLQFDRLVLMYCFTWSTQIFCWLCDT
jgi:hypothetical protein